MAELAKAYVQIIPSAQGIKGKLQSAIGGEADAAGVSAGKSAGGKLASGIKAAIGAAAIGKALSSAIMEGAALEQSIGGIETLFKGSSDAVVKNAQAAFKTAGLSANEYMETATSFAASLLQGLNGDTQEAAKLTDRAIKDMSDNANKMGTDMSMIQNAYQGFAKQNYTMLDNLKLGYGGTKTEMQRLIKDAATMTEEQKALGVAVDGSSMSFDNIVNAISVMQQHLNITGTTAAEAKKTISGSFNSMKAAAHDFMAYLVTGEDIIPAVSNLVTTTSTFLFKNLIPAIGNVVKALPSAIGTSLQAGLPQMFTQGKNMADQMVKGLRDGLPNLINAITGALPNVIDGGIKLAKSLAKGISDNLPAITENMSKAMAKLVMTIINNLPKIFKAGGQIVIQLGLAIIKSIPKVLSAAGSLVKQMADKIRSTNWIDVGVNIVKGIINGIKAWAGQLVAEARALASKALSSAKSFLGIKSPSRVFRDQVGRMIVEGMSLGIDKNAGIVTESMKRLSRDAENAVSIAMPALNMTADIRPAQTERRESGPTYNIGDVSLEVSKLTDATTLEDIVEVFRRAKAFA